MVISECRTFNRPIWVPGEKGPPNAARSTFGTIFRGIVACQVWGRQEKHTLILGKFLTTKTPVGHTKHAYTVLN